MTPGARPRIALIPSRFPYGPREAFLREEIGELQNYAEVFVIPALPGNEALIDGVDASRAPRLPAFAARTLASAVAEFFRAPLRAMRALWSIVRAPSNVRSRLFNLAIYPKALAVARYVRRNRIEHVHAYWLSMPATIARVVHDLAGASWSATGHRYDLVGYNLPARPRGYFNLFSSARFVRTISSNGYERVKSAIGDQTPVVLEHLGVRPMPARRVTTQTLTRFVCIGFLERVKGHDLLLEAFAGVVRSGAEATLTLIGHGTLREALRKRAETLGIGAHVHFEGDVQHRRLLERLSQGEWDVAVLASRDEGPQLCEGIPVSLMECMAAGLPVVATRSGAVPELVDADNGILCAPGSVASLTSSMLALCRSPELRNYLGSRARERVERDFNVLLGAHRLAERLGLAQAAAPIGS